MINEYEIIDFHTHVFPPKLAAPALRTLSERSGIAPACDGTPEGTLSLMDSCGVDGAVLVSVATKPSQQHSINPPSSDRWRVCVVDSDKLFHLDLLHTLLHL